MKPDITSRQFVTHTILAAMITVLFATGRGSAQEPSAYTEQGTIFKLSADWNGSGSDPLAYIEQGTIFKLSADWNESGQDPLTWLLFCTYGKCYCSPGLTTDDTATILAVDSSDPSGNYVVVAAMATTPKDQLAAVADWAFHAIVDGIDEDEVSTVVVAGGDVNYDSLAEVFIGSAPGAPQYVATDWDFLQLLDTMEEEESGL